MRLKTRTALTALLALAVALPVIAASMPFPDVPDDHPRRAAIQWAQNEGLFKGYPDGNFQPDRELSEEQFRKVVDRLFEKYDAWTRADTAEFLYQGLTGYRRATGSATTAPSGQTDCSWPFGAPFWTDQPRKFKFPVKAGCEQAFWVVVVSGNSGQRYNLEAVYQETPNLDWPADATGVEIQVYRGDPPVKVSRNLARRNIATDIPYTTTTSPTTTTTRPPLVTCLSRFPLGQPYWIRIGISFQYPVTNNDCEETFYIEIEGKKHQIGATDRRSPVIYWGASWPESVKVALKTNLGQFGWSSISHRGIASSAPTTTTTTTPSWTIPTARPDRQLKVAYSIDTSDNFNMRWVRPGWETQGWKWRLRTRDYNCGFTDGVGEWNIRKPYSNLVHRFDGLCVRTSPWQIEIVWDNGKRYVSPACFLTRVSGFSRVWSCRGYNVRGWPNYSNIPPTFSLASTAFHSEAEGITSFDVVVNLSRDYYAYMAVCGKKWSQSFSQGDNTIRVHCPTGGTTRVELARSVNSDTRYLNEKIAVPTGVKELGQQTLTPEVRVTSTSPEGTDLTLSQFSVEVIVGSSETARASTVTIYRNRAGWGTDYDGNITRLLRTLTFATDRFVTESGNRMGYAPTFYIQVNEPDAPTHHLTYTFPTPDE